MIKNNFLLISLFFSSFFDCLLAMNCVTDYQDIELISMVYGFTRNDINKLMNSNRSYYNVNNIFFKKLNYCIKNKNNFLNTSKDDKNAFHGLEFFDTNFNNKKTKDILKYALFLIYNDRISTKEDLIVFIDNQKEKFKNNNNYYYYINYLIEKKKIRIKEKLILVSDSLSYINTEIVKSRYLIIEDAINNINLINDLIDESKFLTDQQIFDLFYNLGFVFRQLLILIEALLYHGDLHSVFYMKHYLDVFKKKITRKTYDDLVNFCDMVFFSDHCVSLYHKNKDFYNLLGKELKGVTFVTSYNVFSCDNDILRFFLLFRYDRFIKLMNKLIEKRQQKNFYVLKKYSQQTFLCHQTVDFINFLKIKNKQEVFECLKKIHAIYDMRKILSGLEAAMDEIAIKILPLSSVNSDDIFFLTDKINNKNKENDITKDIQEMLDSLDMFIENTK